MRTRKRAPLDQRFWRYVQPSGEGCWHWQGAVNEHGYGVIGRAGRGTGLVKAHRLAYEIATGRQLRRDQLVCHHCDNPRCVNPDHLFVGTHRDNWNDMHRKGRGSPPPQLLGSKNPSAKLSEGRIPEVFRLRALGLTTHQIADVFGISRTSVCAVLNRKTWRHVHATHRHA